MTEKDPAQLIAKLMYEFNDPDLLREALSHSSFVNEQSSPGSDDNERLEFLGDAVLNLIIGHILIKRYPDLKEGDLSRIRANLVNEPRLAKIARKINLGAFIKLGKGEIKSGGHEKNSILADTFEAVIAAIYLDGGFDKVFNVIETHFSFLLPSEPISATIPDYKSRIQEIIQGKEKLTPVFSLVEEIGPDHDKTFRVKLKAGNLVTEGIGKSKKLAEQNAACKGLEILEPDP